MTPKEKARALAEAVKYCRANNLFLPEELNLLEQGTKEEQYQVMCKAVLRMEIMSKRKA